jgi:hypothetical protein
MKAKYIVGMVRVGTPWVKHEVAIIFPDLLVHSEVARQMMGGAAGVTGAGFFWIDGDEVQVYGISTSLGVSSRPGVDEEFIKRALAIN